MDWHFKVHEVEERVQKVDVGKVGSKWLGMCKLFKIRQECRAFSIHICLIPNLITTTTIASPHPYMIPL